MRLARYAFTAAFAALAAGCAISTQQELSIGQQYAAQLAKELPIIHDPRIQADLDAVAARLTPFSRRPEVRYQFYLVNSATVNAFAVPGGYVYVTRAIVENMTSMDQLAGVLGHEMGHVERRHSARQLGRAQAAEATVGIASVLAGGSSTAERVARGSAVLGAQLILARYSRDQERDADHQAIALTTAAGVNPTGIVDFFRTLRQIEGSQPGDVQQFFASHPMTAERIDDVTARIQQNPQAVALTRTGQRDAPEFARLRNAVRQLPPPPDAKPAGR